MSSVPLSNKQGTQIINNQSNRKFRPEIQGLRALALLLVAAYHLWFGKVSGGVDVFLLISAFLMTGSFVRRMENNKFAGFRSVADYWIHVFKRILPLASVVVVGILLGSYLFLPADRWESLLSEAKSVVFYYQNWWSISNLVDYYAADTSVASPFRHYWSLSVQGQIYLLWPLIFLLGWLIIRATRVNVRGLMLLIFGTIFAGSLAYSIFVTATSQQTAYFNTFARLWEFALGSLVAIVMPWLSINRYVRAAMGWAGIAMIISCGFIFDVEGVFPGYHALWPTLAASMIIIAGDTQTAFGPERLLTLKPLMWLGNYSYGLYLIHWPLLVFFLSRNHTEKAGFVSGVGLLTLSVLFSYIITRYIEQPLRAWKAPDLSPIRGLAVVAACIALVMIPTLGWQGKLAYDAYKAESLKAQNNPGAAALAADFKFEGDTNAAPFPTLAQLPDDWANVGTPCTADNLPFSTDVVLKDHCNIANLPEHPDKIVVAVGNSHMQVWSPALTEYAKENNWALYYFLEGGCFFDQFKDGDANVCANFSNQADKFVHDAGAETVVVTGSRSVPNGPDEVTDGMKDRIGSLTGEGLEVIALRDHPRFDSSFADCNSKGEICSKPAGQDIHNNPLDSLEQQYPGFSTVNLTDLVCPDGNCPSVIGNVYTYMDANHISKSYIDTATPNFIDRFEPAVERAEGSAKSE